MSETMKTHPAADIFPLMNDDELRELADDIKTNGLRQPIVRDDEGRVVDGRNRALACKLAGVEPRYVDSNGDDPIGLAVSLNVKRRNLTKGQRAIAAAEAWDLMGKNTPKRAEVNRKELLASTFGVSAKYVQQARALVERAPDLAARVKAAELSMGDATTELDIRMGKAKGARTELQRLRDERPDLAEQVQGEVMTLGDAIARAEADARDEKQRRWAATTNVVEAITNVDLPSDAAVETADLFDHAIAEQAGQVITADRLRRGAEYLTALADAFDERKDDA